MDIVRAGVVETKKCKMDSVIVDTAIHLQVCVCVCARACVTVRVCDCACVCM